METGIYVASVALAVFWSVYLHISWSSRARLPEDAGGRSMLVVVPSTYLLLVVLAGWQRDAPLRLDLIGLLALDAVTMTAWVATALTFALSRTGGARSYRWTVISYNLVAVLTLCALWALRLWPSLLERMRNLVEQGKSLELASLAWIRGGGQEGEPDLATLLKRVLIAALGYIPISLVRMVYGSRSRRRTMEELAVLRRRLDRLERLISAGRGISTHREDGSVSEDLSEP